MALTNGVFPRDLPDGVKQFWHEHPHYGGGIKLWQGAFDNRDGLPGGANEYVARKWLKENGWRYEQRSHMYFQPNHFNDPDDWT